MYGTINKDKPQTIMCQVSVNKQKSYTNWQLLEDNKNMDNISKWYCEHSVSIKLSMGSGTTPISSLISQI